MRRLVPLLALVALPACRTVYTVAPPATLEEVVARLGDATVTLTMNNGSTQRIRRLRLTDSTLVFSPSRRSTVHEVPRQDVLQLAAFNAEGHLVQGVLLTGAGFSIGGGVGGAGGFGMCGGNRAVNFPQAAASLYCALVGFAVGGLSGAILAPTALNPRREHILYRRPPSSAAPR